jgi:hypothetical protein
MAEPLAPAVGDLAARVRLPCGVRRAHAARDGSRENCRAPAARHVCLFYVSIVRTFAMAE